MKYRYKSIQELPTAHISLLKLEYLKEKRNGDLSGVKGKINDLVSDKEIFAAYAGCRFFGGPCAPI